VLFEPLKITSGLADFFRKEYSSYQNIEIHDLKQIMGGYETLIYSFILKYEENGKNSEKKLVLRAYTTQSGAEMAKREHDTLIKLKEVNYPVPRVYFQIPSSSYIGKPFIILEYIDGILMGEMMINALEKNDSKRLQDLSNQFTDLYIDLHKISWQTLITHPYEYLQNTKQKLIEFISWYGKKIRTHNLTQLIPILKWLQTRLSSVQCKTQDLALNHGDYHPNNIMITDSCVFVIDWHGIRIRDYRIDLGQTSILLEMYASKALRDGLIANYESKTRKIEDFAFFEVVLLLVRFYEFFDATIIDEASMTKERVRMFKEQSESLTKAYSMLIERTGQQFPNLERTLKRMFN
jgi:aminoglycoside phosphotransferase (APT) family kinase protein